MQERQVFQTNSRARWRRFKWGSRALLLLIPISIFLIVFALLTIKTPPIPQLKAYKQVLTDTQGVLAQKSTLAKKYQGFRQYITQKELTNKAPYASAKVPKSFRDLTNTNMPCGIRAAFYVTWNSQSFVSLQHNINKLNLVIPEWFFIDPNADTLISSIDDRGLAIMRNSGVNIMPILTNAFKGEFHGASVSRIIHDPAKKERLLHDLINMLTKNKFIGVNVDLEELEEKTDEPLIAFQKELYERMRAHGFIVSQDVIPFNKDYDYKALGDYNDYLFVMAYDQHSQSSKAGSIADQKWIEAAVDEAVKQLPARKLILGMAAYGYDWPREENKPEDVNVLTYQNAISVAKESQSEIDYDNDTYNLHFSYFDEDNLVHDVYFTDAATTFNAMRFASEVQMAGVALWRLGSEDERIWNFYNENLSKDSLNDFDFSSFSRVQSSENVSYSGFGEILDVIAMPKEGTLQIELDSTELLISEENYSNLPTSFMAKKYSWNGADTIRNKKKIVLTFDDGPDPTWTPKILDILAEKHVPATFFIVGMNAEDNIPIVKRIYREGHELGNHTFTHPNIAEVSQRRAIIEMESTRLLLECITGHSTVLFRAPFNADFTPEKMEELVPVEIARRKNYLDVGESIDPLDWEPGVKADAIFNRIITRKAEIESSNPKISGGNIILLHDAGGDTRRATYEALPRIIDYYQSRGYTFTTVADLLGKKKDEVMPPVAKGSGYYLIQLNYYFFVAGYWISHILSALFITFILMSIARILLMAFLALKEKHKEGKEALLFPALSSYPLVSIIVPAYNEEVNAVGSLNNLLRTDYPNFEVIFVDDGSKDETYQRVYNQFKDHAKVTVFTKPNGGKASALNYGIALSKADYVVCIDADTKLQSDAVSQLMKHFLADDKKEIGAVAGNVKVGNEINLLTKWQAIEYISSQNFDRRAFASVNAITVVPGAIGGFYKQAIEDAGGFTSDTLAEDCDLTIRILREGYLVKNENKAIALTEAPEKTKQFLKQRFRWSFGILQSFWKHRDLLLNWRYRWLGCLAMPNILLFQYIIPAFIPLADVVMLMGLLSGNSAHILPYYIAFMIFDAGIALIAFRMERESIGRLIWLIPQRLIYRWLMWIVLYRALRRAMKGELQNWGVLKRTGRVKETAAAL